MSSSGSIRVEHLWKRFRQDTTGSLLSVEYDRLIDRIRRRDTRDEWRWVLRDVNFDIEPGASVGLVGTNGSGKSTLLKLLVGAMFPYAGRVETHGRIGALIEVQSGMHPELSGRENILLYGSLVGMNLRSLKSRFDDIVEFAEIGEAIERQLKFYSTGMKMRLGFAVSVHVEPEILLVDEVLAVGDTNFQQKCLQRIAQMRREGTTVVLVSHDLISVEATCGRGIWIEGGEVRADGPIRETLGEYRRAIEERVLKDVVTHPIRVLEASVSGEAGSPPMSNCPVTVTVVLGADAPQTGFFYIGMSEGAPTPIFTLTRPIELEAGTTELRCNIDRLPFARGRYYLWCSSIRPDGALLLDWQPACKFEVKGPVLHGSPLGVVRLVPVLIESDWTAIDEATSSRLASPGSEG